MALDGSWLISNPETGEPLADGPHDRIHVRGTDDLRDQLVAAWAQDRRSGEALMVAGTRPEVDELNRRARILLQATAEVGPDQVILGGRPFATGDTVLALRNDPATGPLNGNRNRRLHTRGAGRCEHRHLGHHVAWISTSCE